MAVRKKQGAKAPKKSSAKSRAAKKGWETRRKAAEERAERSRRGWETRRRKAAEARLEKAERSDRARAGWARRKAALRAELDAAWESFEAAARTRSPDAAVDTTAWRENGQDPRSLTRPLGADVLRVYEPTRAMDAVNAAIQDGSWALMLEQWSRTGILGREAAPLIDAGVRFESSTYHRPAAGLLRAVFAQEHVSVVGLRANPEVTSGLSEAHVDFVKQGSAILADKRKRFTRSQWRLALEAERRRKE